MKLNRPIILSTDPGIDDALSIIFLSKLNVLGAIWTTFGNNTLQCCTDNAMRLLEILDRKEIPIIEGASGPISGKFGRVAVVHGDDGLGNTNRPVPRRANFVWKSDDYITTSIVKNPKQISMVSVGPLTNLALFVQKTSNDVLAKIKEVIVMGGAVFVPGNVTAFAEFNVFSDPKAAEIVFNSGLDITLVGLDVTHKTVLTEDHILRIEEKNTSLTDFIARMARYYIKFHSKINGCYMHDPLASAIAIDPTLIKKKKHLINVNTTDLGKFGQTTVLENAKAPNISVCVEVDSNRFLRYFVETILQ